MQTTKQTIEKFSSEKGEDTIIRNARLNAHELFERLSMPDLRYGISIRLDISGLDLNKINQFDSQKTNLKISADKPVVVDELKNAVKNPSIRNYFMKNVVIKNKLDAMTLAFWQIGKVIYVPRGCILKNPIEIISEILSDTMMEYLLIIVDDSCEVSIVEDTSSKENNTISYNGKIVEIVVNDNSIVHYTDVQNISRDFFNFVNKRAIVGRNSTMNWLDCCLGTRFTKSDITTVLGGQGAITNNYGMFFGANNQQFDLSSGTIHAEKNTVCDMLTKGALNNMAKAVYSGLIKIQANASGSNGYQKEDTLLLSADAEADSIPQLEIDNNEVRCTHGATVGQVDREKLFYLMSRGLPENLAKKKIVEGFFEPMIQKISVKHVQSRLREIVSDKIVIS